MFEHPIEEKFKRTEQMLQKTKEQLELLQEEYIKVFAEYQNYNTKNHLWRNFDREKPEKQVIFNMEINANQTCIPEIYVLDNRTLFMYLAWYDTDNNCGIFNRQVPKWMDYTEEDMKHLSWCYKNDLFIQF